MEKQLAFCDVQRHFALWKTFRGIAITPSGHRDHSSGDPDQTDRDHPGMSDRHPPESLIDILGMSDRHQPGTLIGIVRNPQTPPKLEVGPITITKKEF